MLFFVEGKIEKISYGLEYAPEFIKHRTVVKAETVFEAEQKYRAYWEDKSDPYCVNYAVVRLKVNEGIE